MKVVISAVLFLFFVSCAAFGSTSIDAKIVRVGVNSNNHVFVQFDREIDEPGCPHAELVLPQDSQIKEYVLSVALSAKLADSTVRIKAKGCIMNRPSLLPDNADWGWFYIK